LHSKEQSQSYAPMNKSRFIYRFVRQGENLASLVARVYGRCNDQLLEMIKQENPRIIDVNRIKVGEIVRFPDLE
jgi:phage tail protein X